MAKRSAAKPTDGAPAKRSRVFIVEDHPFFREGLVNMLNREPGLLVCGQADNAETALTAIPGAKPDLVLVDISLPGRSGLELIKELRLKDKQVKVLVVSMHDEALYADRVLRAGGNGYIMKDEDPEELSHAIRDVLNGHLYVSEEVLGRKGKKSSRTQETQRPLDQLTDEELEMLELLGKGETPTGIAKQMRIPAKAVADGSTRIRRKLGLKTPNELLRYAVCWVETGRC